MNAKRRPIRCILFVTLMFSAALISSSSLSLAQQPTQEERQRAIDWFVNSYYYPRLICEHAGSAELARLDDIIAKIKGEYPRAFEIAESTKEYATTTAKVKTLVTERFRDKTNQKQAATECASLTEQMTSAYKRRRHDDLFKYFLKQFSAPT